MGALTRSWYLLVFILIISLLYYDNIQQQIRQESVFSLNNYYQNHEKYGDYKDQRFGKITNITADNFYFDMGSFSIKVEANDVKPSVYGETTALLYYSKDGSIYLIDYHNYNYNYILYILSFIAFIIFLIIFFKEWKPTIRGFKDA
ncbi:MAG: hypothetical protein ABIJ08_05515 [Nanoarchaeota archaeon]